MGLLDLYENAHRVRTEYHRSIASIDHDFASDLAASYNRALEEEERVCENEADDNAQQASEFSDEIDVSPLLHESQEDDFTKHESQEDDFAKPALDAAPASSTDVSSVGYERTVEICKRPGEARVGLELEKIRRD
eukprot:6257073-Prymnesium_polylepis.1